MQFWPYILTWRLAAALVLIGLAVIPIRKAYRMLRNGDVWVKGVVEEVFLSSLCVSVAAAFYPFVSVLIPVVWYIFIRKHLLVWRGFLASLVAISLVALYTWLFCYYTGMPYYIW